MKPMERTLFVGTRRVRIAAVLSSCLLCLSGIGVAASRPESSTLAGARCHRATQVMGTLAEAEIFGESEEEACRTANDVLEIFREVDAIFSTYKPESPVSLLNRHPPRAPTAAPASLVNLVLEAERYSRLSGGAFDVTIWPLIQLWGFQENGADRRPPTKRRVRKTSNRIGFQRVAVEKKENTLAFSREGMGFDFGGIAKGYALDLAAEMLSSRGVEQALIDLGGSFFCRGWQSDGEGWILGIQHPTEPDSMIDAIRVADRFVSSSGNYERYLIWDGVQYGHILDPKTGWPAKKTLSTTVIAAQGTASDALSTAVFVLGPRKGLKLLESMPDVEGVIYYEKRGALRSVETSGFGSYRAPMD